MSHLDDLIPRPHPDSTNKDLTYCRTSTILEILGKPRRTLTRDCAPITNPTIRALMVTESVGPFRVTGLRPAVESLRRVMAAVKAAKPDVYREVRTAGMTCCRAVRGSSTRFSNHSWGTAIDLYFGDVIDLMGDGKTQKGLLALYPHFHAEGWYWGSEFTREDSMHQEVADETMWKWAREGRFKV